MEDDALSVVSRGERPPSMNIKIRTLNGPDVELVVLPTTTVLDLKHFIHSRTRVPVTSQRLIYRGRVLEDPFLLVSYNLEDGHTLHMVQRVAPAPAQTAAPSRNRIYPSANLSARLSRLRSENVRTSPSYSYGESPSSLNSSRVSRNMASLDSNELFNAIINGSLRDSTDGGDESVPGQEDTGRRTPLMWTRRTTQHPTREALRRQNDTQNLEHIRQGLLTIHTLMSGMGLPEMESVTSPLSQQLSYSSNRWQNPTENPTTVGIRNLRQRMTVLSETRQFINRLNTSSRSSEAATSDGGISHREGVSNPAPSRRFYAGQWVDCKDTVGNWLEATVMSVRYNAQEVLIRYNGWPTRWDEWIDRDSPRLAPFCTRTNPSANNLNLSPIPRLEVSQAPTTGIDDVRLVIPEVMRTFEVVQNLFRRLSINLLVRRQPTQNTTRGSHVENPDELPWDTREQYTPSRPGLQARITIQEMARDAAPLFDRFGRLLADLAPFLADLGQGGNGQRAHRSEPRDPSGRSASPDIRRLVSSNTQNQSSNAGQIEIHVHAVTVSANPTIETQRRSTDTGRQDSQLPLLSPRTPDHPPTLGLFSPGNEARTNDGINSAGIEVGSNDSPGLDELAPLLHSVNRENSSRFQEPSISDDSYTSLSNYGEEYNGEGSMNALTNMMNEMSETVRRVTDSIRASNDISASDAENVRNGGVYFQNQNGSSPRENVSVYSFDTGNLATNHAEVASIDTFASNVEPTSNQRNRELIDVAREFETSSDNYQSSSPSSSNAGEGFTIFDLISGRESVPTNGGGSNRRSRERFRGQNSDIDGSSDNSFSDSIRENFERYRARVGSVRTSEVDRSLRFSVSSQHNLSSVSPTNSWSRLNGGANAGVQLSSLRSNSSYLPSPSQSMSSEDLNPSFHGRTNSQTTSIETSPVLNQGSGHLSGSNSLHMFWRNFGSRMGSLRD